MPAVLSPGRQSLLAEGLKPCSGCGEVKPLDEFHRRAGRTDGRQNVCKSCGNADYVERQRANPEKYQAHQRRWRESNPERARAISRRKQSRRRAHIREAFVEDVDPLIVFQRDEGVCGLCGDPVERDSFDVDHTIPLALGGEHSYENVRLTHPSCNRRRGRKVAVAASRGKEY